MKDIIVTRRAQSDLDDIWYYIAQDNVKAADSLLDTIVESLKPALLFENYGYECSFDGQSIRKIPCGSYLVFFCYTDGGIELLRVIHGARDLQKLTVQ